MEVPIEIESVGFGGSGIGRWPDGRACFVPFTLPGERALVRGVREKKSYIEAEVVRLTERSVSRIASACPIFGNCGGCALQHASYPLQLEIKTSQVREILRRLGGLENPEVREMLPSPEEWGYRTRVSVHCRDGRVGFFGRKSHRIVPAASCPIASPEVNTLLGDLARNPPSGEKRITLREKQSHRGFSQVNRGAAEVLADVVCGMLPGGGDLLVDAYCGAGFFSGRLAGSFGRVIGIEWSAGAVAAARQGAACNTSFVEGPVERHLAQALESAPPEASALVVDPPDEGLSPEVVGTVLARPPASVIYVSCDPPTLARDLKKLSARYAVEFVQPVDMFPQTADIEAVAKLSLL